MLTTILTTFVIGIIFVQLSKIIAIRYDIVDKPDSNIKTHTKITPYLGGLGIILTFYLSFFIFNSSDFIVKYFIELLSIAGIFLLGLFDDKFKLSIRLRLAIQIFIALLLLFAGNILNITGVLGVDSMLTLFIIIFMINAMNILDILDGLAAGITVIILGTFVIINSLYTGNEFYIFISLIYSVTLVSFLMYNFNPASIFMGDAGSTVLGLFLVIVFINTYNLNEELSHQLASIIALSLPIFEVIYVSVLRLKKGKSPMHGSKDHFALRQRMMGHSVKETVILAYGTTFLTLLTAYVTLGLNNSKAVVIFCGVILSFIIFGYILSKIKIDEC